MTFTETNKGSKSTFAYEYIPFKSAFWTKKLTFIHLCYIQSIEGYKCCNDMFQLQMHNIGVYTVEFLYQGHDVFDIFVSLLTECTEFLWDIN